MRLKYLAMTGITRRQFVMISERDLDTRRHVRVGRDCRWCERWGSGKSNLRHGSRARRCRPASSIISCSTGRELALISTTALAAATTSQTMRSSTSAGTAVITGHSTVGAIRVFYSVFNNVFNSWCNRDRNMFLVNQPDDDGAPSVYPQFDTLEKNLMIANYNSQEAVDNDDGSGFFHTYSNVLVYGHYGQKADMAGHDNHHVGNLYAYVFPECYCDLGGGEVRNSSHRDIHTNNTCIQGQDIGSYASIRCDKNGTEDSTQPYLAYNTIYNPSGKTGVCGMDLAAWQALGYDPGTTVHGPIPSATKIVAMAAKTLGMKPHR